MESTYCNSHSEHRFLSFANFFDTNKVFIEIENISDLISEQKIRDPTADVTPEAH